MIHKDKLLHFLISFILIFLFALIFILKYAIAIVLIIGIIKELYDYFINKSNDCISDFIANCYGILLAIIILKG